MTAVVLLATLGAGTGRTFALWRDSAAGSAGAASAATMRLTADGSTTATVAGPSLVLLGPDQVVTVTLRNDAPATARNLRTAVYLDNVTGTSLLSSVVLASATTTTSAAQCTPATAGFQAVGAWTSTRLGSGALKAGEETTLCVTLRLSSAASSLTTGSGSLTLSLRGQQVRP